jgi:hypothetical protein
MPDGVLLITTDLTADHIVLSWLSDSNILAGPVSLTGVIAQTILSSVQTAAGTFG